MIWTLLHNLFTALLLVLLSCLSPSQIIFVFHKVSLFITLIRKSFVFIEERIFNVYYVLLFLSLLIIDNLINFAFKIVSITTTKLTIIISTRTFMTSFNNITQSRKPFIRNKQLISRFFIGSHITNLSLHFSTNFKVCIIVFSFAILYLFSMRINHCHFSWFFIIRLRLPILPTVS